MTRATDRAGTERYAPEAESPSARTDEQEVASGRTASTPVAVLTGVVGVVAALVAVVAVLVVLGYVLA